MSAPAIGRLRWIGILEGTSFLLLVGVAMPLKYAADMPAMVTQVGWIHGLLFLAYLLALAHATLAARWSWRAAAALFLAAVVPAGPFIAEPWLRRQQRAALAATAAATER